MLKRMVPFNTSFKSNTKQQVIHNYHHLDCRVPPSCFHLLSAPPCLICSQLSVMAPVSFFHYLPSLAAASLPLGPLVSLMHGCTCIDLQCTRVVWIYIMGNACVVWSGLLLLVLVFSVCCSYAKDCKGSEELWCSCVHPYSYGFIYRTHHFVLFFSCYLQPRKIVF